YLLGMETISLRFFNFFGPGQVPHPKYAAVIPAFIESILNDKSPIIFADVEQTRDFNYIDNVVPAYLLAAKSRRLQGYVSNIGSGSEIVLNDLIKSINTI